MASRTFTHTRTRAQTQIQTRTDSQHLYRLDFGTHRGRTVDEVPASYVRWLVSNEDVYARRLDLKAELERRGDLKKRTATKKRAGSPKAGDTAKKRGGGGGGTGGAGKKGGSRGTGSEKSFEPFQSAGNTLGG